MLYNDNVYGRIEIKEKALIDLINSKAVQRLKGVYQGPSFLLISNPIFGKYKNTRFEHSVGVLILLKKLEATLNEQIAGLLHDISHTVFSHATDFLFNRHIQHDYHEKFHDKMILKSDIPMILNKHHIDVTEILDEKKFTLLEKELPDLCADRIDYFLRDMIVYDSVIKNNINTILNSLMKFENEIIFNNLNTARLFAEKYIEANKLLWCNPYQVVLFKLISDILKLGLSKGIITREDLFTTDNEVLIKLKNSNDNEINEKLNTIFDLKIIENKKNYDYHLKSKVRCIDPKILIDKKIASLSGIDEHYKKLMNDFVPETSKGFFIKIINSETIG